MLLVTTATLAMPSAATAVSDFRTPKRAAYCGTDHYTGRTLVCWTPNDGFTVRMTIRGKASKRYDSRNRHAHDTVGRVLRFGDVWQSGNGFTCESRRTGLTCTNARGRGWWLGRFRGYRLF